MDAWQYQNINGEKMAYQSKRINKQSGGSEMAAMA
jgi:hypothetical protein